MTNTTNNRPRGRIGPVIVANPTHPYNALNTLPIIGRPPRGYVAHRLALMLFFFCSACGARLRCSTKGSSTKSCILRKARSMVSTAYFVGKEQKKKALKKIRRDSIILYSPLTISTIWMIILLFLALLLTHASQEVWYGRSAHPLKKLSKTNILALILLNA
jgi:hypothetical protein